jgi:hypothetical protein
VERSIDDNDGKWCAERKVCNIEVAEEAHKGGFVLEKVSEVITQAKGQTDLDDTCKAYRRDGGCRCKVCTEEASNDPKAV